MISTMDSEKKQSEEEEEEGEIPVLTVLKNNTILKNIFIVNKPVEEKEKASREDHVDVVLVGRHPDCDLMLTHPSISRFHLQICSKPSSRTFSVVDLSSVHGTWMSGRRIEPMVSVEMKEGDALRIGVSSRVYRLHWIPISRAYDLENPFLSQLDTVAEVEEEEEEEKMQNLNCTPADMEEIEPVYSIIEDISSLFLEENGELTVKEEIPLAPWMLEDIVSSCCEEERKSQSKDEAIGIPSVAFGTKTSYLPTISDDENNLCDSVSRVLSPPYMESLGEYDDTLTQNLSETLCLPAVEAVLETKMLQFHTLPDSFTSLLLPGLENSFEKHYSSLPVHTDPSSLDEKSAAEAVIMPKETDFESECRVPASFDEKGATEDLLMLKESDYECTFRNDGSVTDAFTAGAEIFHSEDMFFTVEEATPGTKVERIQIVDKIAMDSLSDEEKLQNDKFCDDKGHSLIEIVQDVRNMRTDSISPTPCQIELVNLSMPPKEALNIVKEDQTLQSDMEILESCVKAVGKTSTNYKNIWSRRGKATSAPQVRTSKNILKNATNVQTEVASSNEKDIRSIPKNLSAVLDVEEEKEIFTPDKENISPNTLRLQFLKKGKVNQKDIRHKTISKDLFSVLDAEKHEEEIYTPDKENLSPNTLHLRLLNKKGGKVEEIKRSKSRRSPLSKGTFNLNQKDIINKTISKDLLSDLDGEEEEEEIYTPDKENFSPNTLHLRLLNKKGKIEEIKRSKSRRSPLSKGTFNLKQKDIINKTVSKDLLSDLDGEEDEEEEEIFTPDKENLSPSTLRLQLLKKKGKVEETKHSKSPWSQNSKDNFGPNIYSDENMNSLSNQENQTLKGAQDHKLQKKPFSSHIKVAHEQDLKDRVERVPFQSLMNSEGKRRSATVCPVSGAKSLDFSNCGQIFDQCINLSDICGVPKKSRWDMIVDTTSLLNKESRKALQLLQGLRGTRLIIPRLVIRELDRMKQQFTIFRRISEASLALEWIEECMVKTNWWIHIQSSVDIAPTPPASPQTQFSEENWSSLSSHKCCSMEIASPTVEDHILDFSLLYKRNQIDGQLVLLSEDITLKIKCMAEGLLCEPVQDFRESLVNPFSERFLWTKSTPLGQTWSCQDDIVLREKYCPFPLWKSSKGVASGLKLILLHSSQYGL
ncbi:hypothetical protein VNO78_33117 [Psophocarpus tetragonolobus]|uniref:FHA domain-containing protein n=1 Tax=Psophocarpus tetragonolobus TaxID=3891 RepID=A0AAN9P0J2_PSOTE